MTRLHVVVAILGAIDSHVGGLLSNMRVIYRNEYMVKGRYQSLPMGYSRSIKRAYAYACVFCFVSNYLTNHNKPYLHITIILHNAHCKYYHPTTTHFSYHLHDIAYLYFYTHYLFSTTPSMR